MKFCVMPLSGLYRRIFSLPVPGAKLMLTLPLSGNCPLGSTEELGPLSKTGVSVVGILALLCRPKQFNVAVDAHAGVCLQFAR